MQREPNFDQAFRANTSFVDPEDGELRNAAPLFSVCTLLTNEHEYQRMRESFEKRGFSGSSTEYLIVDNRKENKLDGYSGNAAMIAEARGRYVLCTHQDLELTHVGAAELMERLAALTELDPAWGVAGIAGARDRARPRRVSDGAGADQHVGPLPQKVDTLDEALLIVRRSSHLAPSRDLSGFHLYGADLCLQASLRGFSAYVIDFHVTHHSDAHVDESYFDCAEAIEAKYAQVFKTRRLSTTFRALYLTGSPLIDRLWAARRRSRREKWKRRQAAREGDR